MAPNYTLFPYRGDGVSGFRLETLYNWVELNKPDAIALTDAQYTRYATLVGCCKREVNGVPVVFLGNGGRVV